MDISNKYRYELTDYTGTFYAYPLGEKSLSLQYNMPENGRADYVIELSGKLKFMAGDYQRLYNMEQSTDQCKVINGNIQRKSGATWVNIASTILSLRDGDWDLDNCVVDLPPKSPKDDAFIESSTDTNLFEKIPNVARITVNTVPYNEQFTEEFQYTLEEHKYTSQTDIWENPAGMPGSAESLGYVLVKKIKETHHGYPQWNLGVWVGCSNSDNPFITYEFTYNRYVAWIPNAEPIPVGWINLNQSDGQNKKIGRAPAINPESIKTNYGGEPCVAYESEVWEVVDDVDSVNDEDIDINIDNGLSLSIVLNILLAPFGLQPKSDFFNINPTSDVYATTNYVTGKATTTANIVVFQKSDIKRHNAVNNSTVFTTSLGKVVSWLVNMFNVRYRVIGGQFIIEHVSFFEKVGSLDFTDSYYHNYLVGKRKYSYLNSELPSKEKFTFMDMKPDFKGLNDFNGTPITYISCVSLGKGEVSWNVDQVSTDILWVLDVANKDAISDDGFVFVSCNIDTEGKYHVMRGHRILGLQREINNVFGWAHLHNDFWRHDRIKKHGQLNGADVTFETARPLKKGVPIAVPFCNIEQFNPNASIITPLGTGDLQTAKFDFANGMLNLEVNYPELEQFISPVFIKLSIENPRETFEESNFPTPVQSRVVRADLTIRFYFDAEATMPATSIPLAGGTFVIKYAWSIPPSGNLFPEEHSFASSDIVNSKAHFEVLVELENISPPSPTMFYNYQLLSRSNYTIIP